MIKKKEEKFTVLMNTSGYLVLMKKKLKTETYLGPCKISWKELFLKIVNCKKP